MRFVINTNVDVLLSNGQDNISSQSKWLYYIKSETERMTKLTSDLLYLAQVDYSDTKMIFSDFDMSEAVENVILTMEAVILENNISLSVFNTGNGIPPEHMNKIFDRFYRTDKSRSRNSGGYGLGLAIAKSIVKQHGGKIWAKSILGGSTTFSVELPQSNWPFAIESLTPTSYTWQIIIFCGILRHKLFFIILFKDT